MPLSDIAIRSAKPREKLVKLSDGGGLQLWLMPNGSKLWRIAYRLDGKQRVLALGPYPQIDLKEARQKREHTNRVLVSGLDPVQQKAREKAARSQNNATTFSLMAAELLDKKRREGKASNTIGKREWLYGLSGDAFGKRPIRDITAPEVLAVLRKVEGKGHHETARRMRSAIGEVFRYAIATARGESDPTQALRGALTTPVVKHRAAITDAKALGALLRAVDGFQGQPTTTVALKLMAYLFPRPGELRLAKWSEFDLDGAVWTIPSERTKMRREHRVPLPVQAVAILKQLRDITGHAALVFPGLGSGRRPISENTLNSALRRMGYGQDEMTAHGFRATASTLLNESGRFTVDAIERALAHQDADAVRKAYARGQHWQERETMGQWWADHLDALRDGAKLITLRGA